MPNEEEERAVGERPTVVGREEQVGGGPHGAVHRRDRPPSSAAVSDSRDPAEDQLALESVSLLCRTDSRKKFDNRLAGSKY